MRLFLLMLLLTSILQAQQKTPSPKQEAAPPKIVKYQLSDVDRYRLAYIQKDWKLAMQEFYINAEAIKKRNKWPDEVICSIETLECSGPEATKQEEKAPTK